jgi:octaprenyl-diphosphate synthase
VQEDGDLEHALKLLEKHETLKETREAAIFWGNKAKQSLEILPESNIRNLLCDLTDYVVNRAV